MIEKISNINDNLEIKIKSSKSPVVFSKNRDFNNWLKGNLTYKVKDAQTKTTKKIVDTGSNLIVYNAKAIFTRLLAQSAGKSSFTGVMNNVRYFNPFGSNPIEGETLNYDNWKNNFSTIEGVNNIKIAYMGFGAKKDSGTTPSPSPNQFGLYNIIDKTGNSAEEVGEPNQDKIDNFFYPVSEPNGYEFMEREISQNNYVTDAILRVIAVMGASEGQKTGESTVYVEAGLFTKIFVENNSLKYPILIARKTFQDFTKTEEIEIEFVWTIWA